MAILTGPEIRAQQAAGEIIVEPWAPENVGPASVDLRLHEDLAVYSQFWPMHEHQAKAARLPPLAEPLRSPEMARRPRPLDMRADNPTTKLSIPEKGLVLYPGILYLGRTVERIRSDHLVPQVTGRSSVGRLGIQVHVTAGYGDPGFDGTITLEILVAHPIRVYANERVCQVFFTRTDGDPQLYEGRYQGQVGPTASRFHLKDGDW